MSTSSADPAIEAAGNSDTLLGMAALGKTAAALALIILVILVLTYLVKRWSLQHAPAGSRLKVVATTAVGSRERVVIVEVEGTWLVLGVASGQVSKLHELPAPPQAPRPDTDTHRFSRRLASALQQQAVRKPPGPS